LWFSSERNQQSYRAVPRQVKIKLKAERWESPQSERLMRDVKTSVIEDFGGCHGSVGCLITTALREVGQYS